MLATMSPNPPLALRINGSLLALGRRPDLSELDPALRGIALSDSPVLLRAADRGDRERLGRRLHDLGRRQKLPLRVCQRSDEVLELLAIFAQGPRPSPASLGTWLLHEVSAWTREEQQALAQVVAAIDEARLQSRLAHEAIPRVVVLEDLDEKKGRLRPDLERRLSFFHIQATPAREQEAPR